jgi:hypothetical protein
MSYKQALAEKEQAFRGDSDEIHIKNAVNALTDDQIEEFLATDEVKEFFATIERDCPEDKCDLEMEISSLEKD